MTADWDATAETARLTADVVCLAPDKPGVLHVLLVLRRWPPFADCWALPGGHVDAGEDVADAARRELAEETGITSATGVSLDLVGVYSAPGRDPRGRYVTTAYVAVLDWPATPAAGDDARASLWVPVARVLADPAGLAFDHQHILTDAVRQVAPYLVGRAGQTSERGGTRD